MTGHDGSQVVGYMDQDAIYYALKFGVYLVTCMEIVACEGKEYTFKDFNRIYDTHDGILVGVRDTGGHAMTKIGNVLYDPQTGEHHEPRGELFKSFNKRGFLARVGVTSRMERVPWEKIFFS